MATILTISGSPSATSRTARLLGEVSARLGAQGHAVRRVAVRDLPPAPLLAGDTGHPAIRTVIEQIRDADGLVVGTPVYKASYTGLLKSLLDLLPQFALADKTVLPLATGGTIAHVLAIDYALRPVLTSMGAAHVSQGYFVLDQLITVAADGNVLIAAEAHDGLFDIVDRFSAAVHRRVPLAAVS